jgi:hypothetical protein
MATVTATTARPGRARYDEDFAAWLDEQAALLRAGRTDALDLANLAEEIEDMGKSEKHALNSNFVVLIKHYLKFQHQKSHRSWSWVSTILEHRRRIQESFEASPSLYRYAQERLEENYRRARQQAIAETRLPRSEFPEMCTYSVDDAIRDDFIVTYDTGLTD